MGKRTITRRGWWSVLLAVVLLVPLASPAVAASEWRMVDLGAGDSSIAFAVNGRGHVVGVNSQTQAFLWRHGRFIDLGIDGVSSAQDVNDRDVVVGYRIVDGNDRAFLWRDGAVVDIAPLPGGTRSYAYAVNDRGEVVGSSEAADGRMHAFHWRAGVLTDRPGSRGAAFAGLRHRRPGSGRRFGVRRRDDAVCRGAVVAWRGDRVASGRAHREGDQP